MDTATTERATELHYRTSGGIVVTRRCRAVGYEDALAPLEAALDERLGALFASSFEYPGRYTRWDMGFVDPPLQITGRARAFEIRALNARGAILLPAVARALESHAAVAALEGGDVVLSGRIAEPRGAFPEEQRSRQPTVFSVLRAVVRLFHAPADPHLGLYGAFGYDLAFQFDPVVQRRPRPADQRDLVLYLPDTLLIIDHRREHALWYEYELEVCGRTTAGLPRTGERVALAPPATPPRACDHAPGAYARTVERAIEAFGRGDLFEVVPGQSFFERRTVAPSELFRRLRRRNPAPYGALVNLGAGEHLVGASPEMYVRVEGRRIETCPISGTVARGADALEDAAQIRRLLESEKEESELTMCTDVDRNDKSRVCVPGTVRVIGRRQIELYSRVIHTVDHVEGTLAEGFDALDGFLAHAWAVTVTGAPKRRAMQFIEDHERSPRRWYGGAIGCITFDGRMNTGLTLRTMQIRDGTVEVRAGATLLFDSDPHAEEAETRLKASALLDAVRAPEPVQSPAPARVLRGAARRVLLVDHEDSFVHTLGGYLRAAGADVVTYRWDAAQGPLQAEAADLVVLSPGPGRPGDFRLEHTIAAALARGLPVFGVCLGLQGIVEYYGGTLALLPRPVHGKASRVRALGGRLLEGLPETFEAGRYHSLVAARERWPQALAITAESTDGLVMAIEHRTLPVAGVQFHPESILSASRARCGERLIANALAILAAPAISARA